ncbi:MAG: hypothetical protein LBR21_11225, partial [Propionibacteriaceae bacterium]|nr:hypothetical protein [Propionibacteriaceae bacterium]
MVAKVFPRPRKVTRLSGEAFSKPAELETELDPSLPEQGYRLQVDNGRARLSYADAAGERYGRDTYAQLGQEPEPV